MASRKIGDLSGSEQVTMPRLLHALWARGEGPPMPSSCAGWIAEQEYSIRGIEVATYQLQKLIYRLRKNGWF